MDRDGGFDWPGSTRLNPERARLLGFAGMDRRFVRGEGVWLFDAHGRRFLDAYAQYGAVALGHNHPRLKDALNRALAADTPAMVQPYPAEYAEQLARALSAFTGGIHTRCVLTSSGAETVEAAIKLARLRSGRPWIVSATGAYHGKTLGALAASDRLDIPAHHAAAGFAHVAHGDIDALAAFLREHGGETAGFIIEPIQGERGIFEAPRGYLPAARRLCEQYGAAFIADEIQTGLYRTGTALACEHEAVTPDILLLSKALGGGLLPLGACLVRVEWWDADFALTHSSTFANNNLACAVGLAVLRELERPELRQGVALLGAQLQQGLAGLAARFPCAVKEVRGRGLLRAIELREPAWDAGCFMSFAHHQGLAAYLFAALLAERGVLALPTLNDSNAIRIAPPLIAEPEHIEQLLDTLGEVLALWETCATDRIVETLIQAQAGREPQRQAAVGNEPTAGLRLPPRRRSARTPLDYAFIGHPTTIRDILVNDPRFARLAEEKFAHYREAVAKLPPGLVCALPPLADAFGAPVLGALIGLPLLPEQMAARGRERVSALILQAVDLAHAQGAKVVGLGAFTSIYTRRGMAALGRGPAITTGSLLTAGMTFRAIELLLAGRGLGLEDCRVGVAGARGSVGMLLAQLAARARPREILLAGRPGAPAAMLAPVAARLRELGCGRVTIASDIAQLRRCNLIISASSSPQPILADAAVQPGAIVCDVARPFDTSPTTRARTDINVIDAGLVALPDAGFRIGIGNLQGLPPGVTLACMAETMLLALRGAARDHGVGKAVTLGEVDAMMRLAGNHGFALADALLPAPPCMGSVPLQAAAS
jgi:acetylornithine/succinyldiaminopimelate/putrescine aminotransferase/predicted amino acid dehydrogenase